MTERRLPNVTMENVRILFRNFSGAEGKYNREGDRNFNIVLPPDIAERMLEDGWNVRFLEPREEGDEPTPRLQVSVTFGSRPPRIVLITSRGKTVLDEEAVGILDWADIVNVDLIIRPYHWDVSGKTGVKAYLQSLFVTIREDELELKYADTPDVPDSAQSAVMETPW